jgi:hypothetical protein
MVGATEHQDLDELLEDHLVGCAWAVATRRMIHSPFGQQGSELLPDRLDDVWWERGHKQTPSQGSFENSPNDRVSWTRLSSRRIVSLSAQPLSMWGCKIWRNFLVFRASAVRRICLPRTPVNRGKRVREAAYKAPAITDIRSEPTMYKASAHDPKSAAPANHIMARTTNTGIPKNRS